MAVVEFGRDKGQCAFAKIESALDRLAEAHFWIHMMEDHYHDADYFRWYLNAFLKAVREVPEMTQKAMTGEAGFDQWFGQQIETLKADGLLSVLRKIGTSSSIGQCSCLGAAARLGRRGVVS